MPLIEACADYVGRSLFVLPYYGYGWTQPGVDGPAPGPLGSTGPNPFRMRMEELVMCAKELLGASGTISEPQHPFVNKWCCFYLRMTDDYNFTTRPGDYMIWIAEEKLAIDPQPTKARFQWVSFKESTQCLCGYGTVAESVQWIREIYDRTMASRREKGGE